MSSHALPNESDYCRYSSVINLWPHTFLWVSEYLCMGDTACLLAFGLHTPLTALLPVTLLSPPHCLFSLPTVDKSKAHIAREQLVSAISNHYCTSQSPSFLQPISVCARHRINPHCFGRCPGTPTLKAPQSVFYILSLFCICWALRLPSHVSFSLVLFLYHLT